MNSYRVTACALDFCRALRQRSRLMRWVFRLAVGRYAYREYELMEANVAQLGYDLNGGAR
jgi:hypothetical protein